MKLMSCMSEEATLHQHIVYPCSHGKYCIHKICDNASSTTINSASAELLVFIFCFQEKLVTAPLPNVIHAPVCGYSSHYEWHLTHQDTI